MMRPMHAPVAHPIRIIDANLVRQLASRDALRAWMQEAMVAASAGQAVMPLRRAMQLPGGLGLLGMMPGHLGAANAAGIKLVSLVPPERRRGSSHLGLMVLYDDDGLVPIAILCGATVTAVRTSAVTALATDQLARPDAHVLALLGTGEQAEAHLLALPAVRRFDDIRVWGRDPTRTRAFVDRHRQTGSPLRVCATVSEAVEGAQVICTLTSSATPVLPGALLQPGMHINLVGSSVPDAAEADDELVRRSRFFVDWRESALNQAGELLHAIRNSVVTAEHIQAELGAVIAGQAPGRVSVDDITVYKSLGIAAQDLMTARRVFDLAQAQDLGQVIHL